MGGFYELNFRLITMWQKAQFTTWSKVNFRIGIDCLNKQVKGFVQCMQRIQRSSLLCVGGMMSSSLKPVKALWVYGEMLLNIVLTFRSVNASFDKNND